MEGLIIRTQGKEKAMSAKMITLENEFHGTSITVRRIISSAEGIDYLNELAAASWTRTAFAVLAKRQLRRIEKALCGMADCKCGVVR